MEEELTNQILSDIEIFLNEELVEKISELQTQQNLEQIEIPQQSLNLDLSLPKLDQALSDISIQQNENLNQTNELINRISNLNTINTTNDFETLQNNIQNQKQKLIDKISDVTINNDAENTNDVFNNLSDKIDQLSTSLQDINSVQTTTNQNFNNTTTNQTEQINNQTDFFQELANSQTDFINNLATSQNELYNINNQTKENILNDINNQTLTQTNFDQTNLTTLNLQESLQSISDNINNNYTTTESMLKTQNDILNTLNNNTNLNTNQYSDINNFYNNSNQESVFNQKMVDLLTIQQEKFTEVADKQIEQNKTVQQELQKMPLNVVKEETLQKQEILNQTIQNTQNTDLSSLIQLMSYSVQIQSSMAESIDELVRQNMSRRWKDSPIKN